MKVLFASSPIIGHVNPLLVAARIVKNAGHTTAFYTGRLFRGKIASAGAEFFPLPADVDHDMRDVETVFPERKNHAPGLPKLLFDMKALFADAIPSQFRGLQSVLRQFPADLIVYETSFCGILPLLLGPRSARPACVYLGISASPLTHQDAAPWGLGLPPATNAEERKKYAAITRDFDTELTNPLREHTDRILHELGVPGLPTSLFESKAILADMILQPCMPGFEYPLREPVKKMHFIGPLVPEGSGEVPAQVKEAKRAGRKVILVSQGTIANNDLGKLLAPTIQALGDRDDFLILATTGNKPVEDIPCAIPANTVTSRFLNFTALMPHVDVLVAFASYGTVTQALSFGVPMVVAGKGEDKPEVGARVAWTGSGIYLPTETPTVEQIREAAKEIVSNPKYRASAKKLSLEFAAHGADKELTQLLEELAEEQAELVS